MTNIVSAKWLKENLNNEKLVIVDCRFDLMNKEYGKESYENNHIKGAVRVDIETELSSKVEEHGGRHPLPSIESIKSTFENLGINNDSLVVCYDEGDLAGPSRLWWILKYLGHDNTYVLDGGINNFIKIDGETTTEIPTIVKGNFDINVNDSIRVDMNYVKQRLYNDKIAIIDSRDPKRYIGEFEPVDRKAGHIPSAMNYFWMDILDKKDDSINIKSKKELAEHFSKLKDYNEVIVYCGSGITACPNSLALTEVGIDHKVYSGSFSDWVSYDDNKVNTTEI